MAEEGQERRSEDLSDEPSPYKMEELRKKGRVAQSRELSSLLGLLAAGTAVYVLSPHLGQQISEFMRDSFKLDIFRNIDSVKENVLTGALMKCFTLFWSGTLPIAAAGFVFGALGSYVQIGNIFSTEPLVPDLQRIDPIQGLKRFFSLKQFLDSIRVVIRGLVLVAVAFFIVRAKMHFVASTALIDPFSLVGIYGSLGRFVFVSLCGVLLIFAGFDFWLHKWEYGKEIRVTRREAKEEHKEREGDPLIKARIRAVQREMARKRMMEAVKKADVVVTNPTHVAVALSYQRDHMEAPKVVAKGVDFLAQKIKKTAAEAGIPLVENVELARALYRSVKIGKYIPRTLYKAVAEVLAYIYKIKNQKWTQ